MRITMYVLNDVRRDSRVLREAASLAAEGHRVTVIGTSARDEPSGGREASAGFEILRIAIPRRWPWWFTWLRNPWRLGGTVRREIAKGVARGPRGWPRATMAIVAAIVSLPWVGVRWAWAAVERAIRGPERSRGLLDYILWWTFIRAWSRAVLGSAPVADIHHANDMDTLPLALAASALDGGRVVYDSHEIFLESGRHHAQPRWVRAALAWWERRMARRAAAVITVNDACAVELRRRLAPRRLTVVHNCSPRWTPPDPPEDRIRQAIGLPQGTPIVLCHGGFQAFRGIEQTVEAMMRAELEPAHLVFLGHRTAYLEPILAGVPADRVHVIPSVAPEEVTAWVAGADVDVMVFQPTELNHVVSTPNKLFESLAAGVPVVSSDFPARRRIVIDDPDGPLGAVCDPTDPDAIAAAIRSILELDPAARADLRRRCLKAAHERWNWETESEKLRALYADLAVGVAPPGTSA